MTGKTATRKTEKAEKPTPRPKKTEKAEKPPKASTKPAAKKVEKTEKPAAPKKVRRVVRKKDQEPVTPVEEVNAETPGETIVTPGGTRKRREVTPESVDAAFGELCDMLRGEIDRVKENKAGKGTGVKFLRSVLKRTSGLQKDSRRVVNRKRRPTKKGNANSGFLKPTAISEEMADFLGVDADTRLSRVDCTTHLHKYIVDNSLQNPDNRREIFPDKSLTKLLRYNKKEHGPLYYFVMQKLIQQHFVKASPTPAE